MNNKLSDLNYKTVGVISSDIDNVTYYLTEYKNITIKTYDDFDKLNVAYEDEIVDYMVLPMYKYIDKIGFNKKDYKWFENFKLF